MRPSEAESFLSNWSTLDRKIFQFFQQLMPVEFVVYSKKANEYESHVDISTVKLPNLTAEEMCMKLTTRQFVFDRDYLWSSNTREMKTGNCNCGAWILKDNAFLHDDKCPRYKNWRTY